jgi:hypothetical protein
MLVVLSLIALSASITHAQVSVDEAQRRLAEKLAQKPPTTQPSTEIEKLRLENLRLRERVMSLEQEVTTLKESLARASASALKAGPGPDTRTSEKAPEADAIQKLVIGRWRGGDITTGTGYTLEFKPDGSYQQAFTTTGVKDAGQFRVFPDSTIEMWTDKWPEDKKHNQYQLATTPVRLTLTPMVLDGVQVKAAKVVVLMKAE